MKRISETEISKIKMVSASDYLSPFCFVPPGTHGFPRGACESCGLYLRDDGGYKIPGLDGIYCSLLCIESGISVNMTQRRKIAGHILGDGYRLQRYLQFLPKMRHQQRLKAQETRKAVLTSAKTPNPDENTVDNKGFI